MAAGDLAEAARNLSRAASRLGAVSCSENSPLASFLQVRHLPSFLRTVQTTGCPSWKLVILKFPIQSLIKFSQNFINKKIENKVHLP